MPTHYATLAASLTAPCDRCGLPARPTPEAFWQGYRQSEGFVFLCAACVPEHDAAYAATRVRPRRTSARRER